MNTADTTKKTIEQQFQELLDKAKSLYPDIDNTISTLNNLTAQTTNLQDYLNLTFQIPSEITSNQILIS